MNGTTNFILDAMQTGDGADFDEVLSQAQALGYAEADPTADIDGLDVKAKIALSCDIAYWKDDRSGGHTGAGNKIYNKGAILHISEHLDITAV